MVKCPSINKKMSDDAELVVITQKPPKIFTSSISFDKNQLMVRNKYI